MTKDRGTTPPARGQLASPYVLAWAILGLLAALYLAALAVRPDLVTQILPVFQPGEPEGNQGQRAMSKALAEVQSLKQSVSQVQLDVAKLKTEAGQNQAREAAVASRLAAIEEKLVSGPAVAAAAPAAAPAASVPGKAAETTKSAAAAKIVRVVPVPRVQADATQPAAQVQAQVPAPIETGSIGAAAAVVPKLINATPAPVAAAPPAAVVAPATPAPATPSATPPHAAADPAVDKLVTEKDTASLLNFGPAVVKPAAEPIGLKISNGPSLDALRLSWSLLADRHSAQLGKLEARYAARVPDNDSEPTFDLIAGPVKSQTDARKICKALAAKSIPCEVSSFSGPAL